MAASFRSTAESFDVEHWPPNVYPNDRQRAHYFLRVHAKSLSKAKALIRIGRKRVVIASRYEQWLLKHCKDVEDYEIAPNRAEPA